MKPSIKNKLSADKIEAANRELNESKPTAVSAKPIIETPKIVETAQKGVYTEGSPHVGIEMSDVGRKPKSEIPSPKSKGEKASRRSKIAILAEEENLRLVRVTIDIPEDLHEKMKIKMILTKQTMKDYLLDFIRKDVGNTNFGYK
jgi:hypothetical protein